MADFFARGGGGLFPSFKISFSFSSKMRRKMFVSEVDKTSVCSKIA